MLKAATQGKQQANSSRTTSCEAALSLAQRSKLLSDEHPEGSEAEDTLLMQLAEVLGIHLSLGGAEPNNSVLDGKLLIKCVVIRSNHYFCPFHSGMRFRCQC
jgi:hypothetical protein